jgi:hypothetical protein
MRRLPALLVAMVLVAAVPSTARAYYYVEYYRDNLFLGLAYHRVGCLTDWYTVQSGQEYDGFTNYDYCQSGTSSNSVPSGEWFDWNYAGPELAGARAGLDSAGWQANMCYATPNYQDRSNSCGYNVLGDCNSDCWIENFSQRQGWTVETASGCWGSPPVSSVNGVSCDK